MIIGNCINLWLLWLLNATDIQQDHLHCQHLTLDWVRSDKAKSGAPWKGSAASNLL